MARRTKNSSKPSAAAVLPAKPARKIVFDDDAELETEGEPAGNALDQQQDEDHDMEDAALEVDPESAEDSDDDAAPEAVGVAEVKEQQAAARAEQAALKKAASKKRSAKAKKAQEREAAKKAVEAEKLRKKQERNAARNVRRKAGKHDEAAATGEYIADDEDEDLEDDEAFNEDADLDQDLDEEEGSDDSEELEDEGPLDAETIRLRARMQAAMEAAESGASAGASRPKTSKGKERATAQNEEDWSAYDMAPLPLPASVLSAAAKSDAARKAAAAKRKIAQADVETESKRTKKKKVKDAGDVREKRINARTTLQVLGAESIDGLPPVVQPLRPLSTRSSAKEFLKRAMRYSGTAENSGAPLSMRQSVHVARARKQQLPSAQFRRQ